MEIATSVSEKSQAMLLYDSPEMVSLFAKRKAQIIAWQSSRTPKKFSIIAGSVDPVRL